VGLDGGGGHNIKISLKQITYELVEWIILPQDKVREVHTVMELLVTSSEIMSFSRRIPLNGVCYKTRVNLNGRNQNKKSSYNIPITKFNQNPFSNVGDE
jgi:hypothetical protein